MHWLAGWLAPLASTRYYFSLACPMASPSPACPPCLPSALLVGWLAGWLAKPALLDPARYYSDLAGPENSKKYQTLIFLAGSASAEFIADVALCPFEAVKVRVGAD
jgi:hypothetical protein